MQDPFDNTLSKDSEWRALGDGVLPADEGMRLDQHLALRFPFLSRSQWKKRLGDGFVRCNAKVARAQLRLRTGDRLSHYCPEEGEPDAPLHLDTIYWDEDLLVVSKPSGLPLHEAGPYRLKTVVAILAREYGDGWAPIHRLDRDTSGLLICARDPGVRRNLHLQIETKSIGKHYLAFLNGCVLREQGELKANLQEVSTYGQPRRYEVTPDDGKHAHLEYRVCVANAWATSVRIDLYTGRTHQIRVQFADLGHPLIGDPVYANSSLSAVSFFEPKRLCLHAERLRLTHPTTGERLELLAHLPENMRACGEKLGILP